MNILAIVKSVSVAEVSQFTVSWHRSYLKVFMLVVRYGILVVIYCSSYDGYKIYQCLLLVVIDTSLYTGS